MIDSKKILVLAAISAVATVGTVQANENLSGNFGIKSSHQNQIVKKLNLSLKGIPTGYAGTLDDIKAEEITYLESEHHYDISATQGGNTHSFYIGNTKYWYTPEENDTTIVNLANTGSVALVAGTSDDYVFTNGTSYWKYDTSKLPQSVFSVTNGTSSDYTYSTTDGTTTTYHKVNLSPEKMSTTSSVGWTKSGSSESDFSYNTSTESGTGTIKVTMPHNGTTANEYYTYTYNKPTGYTRTSTRLDNNVTGTNAKNKLFYNITGSSDGGAIYNNNKTISSVISDFIGNSASEYGGAIYSRGTINNITGDFIGNSASEYGGAIYSRGTINNITGDFIGNKATNYYGGAIYNDSYSTINNITGDFIGNKATNRNGGAICNVSYSTIHNITGDFIGNSAYIGGAIDNSGTITNITGDFIGNSADFQGGAIYNNGTINNITGDFIGNSAKYGGAIYNYSTINNITGDFIGNKATNGTGGGAIYNYGTINNITVDFIGNSASRHGGAIYNTGTININDSSFENNTSKEQGGAIYSTKDITINAQNKAIVFDGNKAKYETADEYANDIYIDGGSTTRTLYLNSKNDTNSITFSDGSVDGSNYNISVNSSNGYAGKVNFNDIMNANNVTVNNGTAGAKNINANTLTLTNGEFKLTTYDTASDSNNYDSLNVDTIVAGDGVLNLANDNIVNDINLGDVDSTSKALKVAIDTDFNNNKADVISANTITGDNGILISSINAVIDTSSTSQTPIKIKVADFSDVDLVNKIDVSSDITAVIDTTISPVDPEHKGFVIGKEVDTENGTLSLTFNHDTIKNAIISGVSDKTNFVMTADDTISEALDMGGEKLTVSLNNKTLSGNGNDGDGTISLGGGADDQSLTLSNGKIEGFGTAITNGVKGTLTLDKVELAQATETADNKIVNNGSMIITNGTKLKSKVEGTTGSTTVKADINNTANTIEADFVQQDLKVESGATLAINDAGKVTITNTIENDGTIQLKGGTNNNVITTSSTYDENTDQAKLEILGNVTLADDVSQKDIEISGTEDEVTLTINDDATVTVTSDAGISMGNNANLVLKDEAKVVGNITTNGTDNSIKLFANTKDSKLSESISGDIQNGLTGSGYSLIAESTGDNTVTIDKAIANAVNIEVEDNSNAIITDVAIDSLPVSPTTAKAAEISVGNNSNLTLQNTKSDDLEINSMISSEDGESYVLNLTNDNADKSIVINKAVTGASQVNVKSGIAEVNVDEGGSLATSPIKLENKTTVIFDSSEEYTVNNDVTGEGVITDPSTPPANYSMVGFSSQNNGTKFNIASTITNASVVADNIELGLTDESHLNNANAIIQSNATLNTINSANSDFQSIIFEDNASLKFDTDAISKTSDNFANTTQMGNVTITDINLASLDKVVENYIDIDLVNSTGLSTEGGKNVTISDELLNKKFQAMTPVRIMEATVDNNGMMNIHPSSGHNAWQDFNPAALVGPIAAQIGGLLTQLNSYDEAFRNMDMYMLMPKSQRTAMKFRNKYATTASDYVFDPTNSAEENKGLWFRPYATFENVPLHNGPEVSNIAYGSFFGGDSGLQELKHGWDGMWGAYVGYNGSHQTYNNVGIYQNGGTLGAVGMLFKDNFFAGLTINVGGSAGEGSTRYGTENFGMLMGGAAVKTGYNWELADGKFIIQPSLQLSYSLVNTFDYRNAAGVNINSNALNAIQIEPGLKFIGNLKNGWQPYAGVSVVFNALDQASFYANDITLPSLSINPYIKYGLGVRKVMGDRLTGFLQSFITNGGRNGVGVQLGFRYAIGKDSSSSAYLKNSGNIVGNYKKPTISLSSNNNH